MTILGTSVENVIVIAESKRGVTLSLDPGMDHRAVVDTLCHVDGIEDFELQLVVKVEKGIDVDMVIEGVQSVFRVLEGREITVHGPIAF